MEKVVSLTVEGEEEISAEEFRAAEANSKANVYEVKFPNGHMETGFVKTDGYTRRIVIEYETPFKLAPTVLTVFENATKMHYSTSKAVIEYSQGWKGALPYTVIGLDVEQAPATFDLSGTLDDLEQGSTVKAALAAVGGAGGGAGISHLTR